MTRYMRPRRDSLRAIKGVRAQEDEIEGARQKSRPDAWCPLALYGAQPGAGATGRKPRGGFRPVGSASTVEHRRPNRRLKRHPDGLFLAKDALKWNRTRVGLSGYRRWSCTST